MENPAAKLWVWQWWVSNQRQVVSFHCAKCMKVHCITCGVRLKTPEVFWKKKKQQHCFYVEKVLIKKNKTNVLILCVQTMWLLPSTTFRHKPQPKLTHSQTTVLLTVLDKSLVSMSLEINGVVCDKSPLFFLSELIPLDQNLLFPYSRNWHIWTG